MPFYFRNFDDPPKKAINVPTLPDTRVTIHSITSDGETSVEIGKGKIFQSDVKQDMQPPYDETCDLYITDWSTPVPIPPSILGDSAKISNLQKNIEWLTAHLAAILHAVGDVIILTTEDQAAGQNRKVFAEVTEENNIKIWTEDK